MDKSFIWTPEELDVASSLLLLQRGGIASSRYNNDEVFNIPMNVDENNNGINKKNTGIDYSNIKIRRETKQPKKFTSTLRLDSGKSFQCKKCGSAFETGPALGGHKKSCNKPQKNFKKKDLSNIINTEESFEKLESFNKLQEDVVLDTEHVSKNNNDYINQLDATCSNSHQEDDKQIKYWKLYLSIKHCTTNYRDD